MNYTLQDKQTFEKQLDEYLSSNPTHLVYERNKIDSFASSKLSDLYKLFLDLEGHKLDSELFIKLKKIISNCSVDPNQILMSNADMSNEYIISEQDLARLVNIIKSEVLDYINNSSEQSPINIDKEEFSNLYVIVHKLFPKLFYKGKPLIKNKFVQQTIMETLDVWNRHNTKSDDNIQGPREINRDILGAIYIIAKKAYPELNIYLPARIKSPNSSVNNIIKEIDKSFFSIIPSDPSKGISDTDIQEQFNLDKAKKDFTGFTFVLSNTDDTLHFDTTNPKHEELVKLRKSREQNIKFYHSLESFLNEHDINSTSLSNIQLLQIKIELLERLRSLTYEECTKEYNGTSFTQLLDEAITTYEKISNDSEIFYEDDTYEKEIDEIYKLLDELKNRVHDKYQAKILEIILPNILNDSLLTQDLGVKSRFVKSIKKENGFCADYYELKSPDGREIELQVITNHRFKESKSGSSSHSNLSGKIIDISHFFEPSSDNITQKNFNQYLQLLNNTPISERNLLYSKPIEELTHAEKRKKRRLQLAEQSIKLGDSINIESTQELDPTILREIFPEEIGEDGVLMDIDVYLPIFASYVSPDMVSVGSHHTRFNDSVASYDEKSETSAFKEVLLQDDQISCLSQILIERLDPLLANVKSEITLNGIKNRCNLNNKSKKISAPSIGKTTTYHSVKGELSPLGMYRIIQNRLINEDSNPPNFNGSMDNSLDNSFDDEREI